MVFCNIMTCQGFSQSILGGCSMIWIAVVVLFFIIVLSRRWVAEAVGFPWSNIGAFILGYGALILVAGITCSHKWALLAGIVGAYAGGYFGSYVLGESGGGY
jgi:uncharacterized membrane protein YkgB